MSSERVLTARLRYMDALLERLREAGFSAETTYHAYHVLDAHIFGFSLWQAGHSFKAEDLQDLAATFLEKFRSTTTRTSPSTSSSTSRRAHSTM